MTSLSLKLRFYLAASSTIFCAHLVMAASSRNTFAMTVAGDTVPCLLLVVATLAVRDNFRKNSGILLVFWKLFAMGLLVLAVSQAFWIYYDVLGLRHVPSPVIGDSLFLLAHVFFLFALALRPHSAEAGKDFKIRRLDLTLLALWWFALYGYFAVPWLWVIVDFKKYTPADYSLILLQHLALIGALTVLLIRNPGAWRRFYGYLLLAFVLIAVGNLQQSIAIEQGHYYAGSFYDTAFLLSMVWFTVVACQGPRLEPQKEKRSNRELKQSLWTARIAMVAILSLPVLALVGHAWLRVPASIEVFRLKVVFSALFVLGALTFWKLSLIALELERLVDLTQASIENVKAVQARITQSQKLAALGRLAAGATHEISNPLTAILGYSELLADIPTLTPRDQENAVVIREQVHRAQAAVNSLRNTLRSPSAPHPRIAHQP